MRGENKRQFIKGMESIIDIAPKPKYEQIIPKQTLEQRTECIWNRVKIAFEKTLKEFPHEEEK